MGPLFELDLGARLGRRYNLFLLWERGLLAGPAAGPSTLTSYRPAATPRGESTSTDYYALGVRFSSDPDHVGFLAEIDLGLRRMTARWDDGTELRFSEAPFEFRLGLGADLRFSRSFSLSPLATVGTGVFGEAEWSYPDGSRASGFGPSDLHAAHGWVSFEVGGHFDLGS